MDITEITKRLEVVEAQQGDLVKRAEKAEEELAKEKQLRVEAEAVSKLSDVQRVAFDKFSEDQRKAFFAADEAGRADLLEATCSDDMMDEEKELAKTATGRRLLELRKQNEDLLAKNAATSADIAKLREERDIAEFTKRAETDLPNIPGDPIAKGRTLYQLSKSVDKATHDAVMQMLKAGNAALAETTSPVSKSVDSAIPGTAVEAEKKLDTLAKARCAAKGVSYAVAYGEVLKENRELYELANQR